MTDPDIQADLRALEHELASFERKYEIRSRAFYEAHMRGDEPDDESWVLDFGEWASVYRAWLLRKTGCRSEVEPSENGLDEDL